MNADEIAHKYVHGNHDALTDSQEKKDMAEDIRAFAEEQNRQLLKCLHQSYFFPSMMRNEKAEELLKDANL